MPSRRVVVPGSAVACLTCSFALVANHDTVPSKFVGPDKLFVDVGLALGLTSMLITFLYPATTVVRIKPTSPSWLIQNINYCCNLSHN